jgi:BirA family biotin operon repressor/biotin-[acetyl-CoA-carboxylase] ligase
MLAYTDSPDFAEFLLGAPPTWIDSSSLPEAQGAADAALLRALFPRGPVLAAEIPEEGPWKRLVLVERAASSQLDALAESCALPSGLPDGTLSLAGTGTGFHGQRERPWSAAPGNLHLSAYLAPDLPAGEAAVGCTALPVLAALDCADEALGGPGRAGIKWVNDILVEGRKVAGALTRTRCRGDRITDLVLGIGINVETTPRVAPDRFVRGVTCLRELAPDPAACSLAGAWRALARALGRRYRTLREGGATELVEAYRSRSSIVGRRVRILADPPEGGEKALLAQGRVAGIDDDLGLRLEGREASLTRGRLVLED